MKQEFLIPIKGATWKHRILERIAKSKEFPTRLRLFHGLKSILHIDLLLRKTPSNVNLLLDVTDWVQSQIYFYGNYENDSISLFKELAIKSHTIFDIGAHIGQYALEAAKMDVEKKKQIFAIEANPKTFSYLLNNIQLNDSYQITPVLGAVAEKHELANMNIPAYWNMGNTQLGQPSENTTIDNYLISTFNFRTLLQKYEITIIDLIKIDIEGHEYGFFKDLFEHQLFPEHILFEYIPEVFSQAHELVNLLIDHKYQLTDIYGKPYLDNQTVPEQNLWAKKL